VRIVTQQQQLRALHGAVVQPSEYPPFTVAQIVHILGVPRGNAEQNWPLIWQALQEFGMGDRATAIAALATIRVECPPFKPIHEYGSPSDWAGYDGGPIYAGRGLIQLTHEYNYQHYGDELGVDLVNNPDLALDPTVSARVLALYFAEHGIQAMANAGEWRKIRRAVNGGYNGLDEFLGYVNALEAL
jgi:hypothetical protein